MKRESSNRPHRLFFWCAAIILGLLQIWAHRNDINPDGISYIEIAWAAVHTGFQGLVNGYWSPLYPFLLSICFRVVHPSAHWEFAAVHVVNLAIYLASLACFEVLLSELVLAQEAAGAFAGEIRPVPSRIMWIWGHVFFFWAGRFWLSPAIVTPDLTVAALVYLATAILLRIARGKANWLTFTAFGAILGAAYLAKAAMFPLAFAFLASSFFLMRSFRVSSQLAIGHALLAAAVFLLVAAPFVIALSRAKGRPTFGDSGRINYTEYANRAPLWVHWQGEPPGTGIPEHPTRKLLSDPPFYEFAYPVPGTYPPWYDPSYWDEGMRPHFSLKGQLWVLFRAANTYLKLFSRTGALYLVMIALSVWVRRAGKWEPWAGGLWWAWIPCLAALGMYALVHVEERFVSCFALMLLMWVLSSVRISEMAGGILGRRARLAIVMAPALAAAWSAGSDIVQLVRNRPYQEWEVACGLREMGISPGTNVGYVGTGLDAYWAHLAGVRLIAEIPEKDQSALLAADSARREAILGKFAEIGAKAIVTKNYAVVISTSGWKRIRGTPYYLNDLMASGPRSQTPEIH
jgi:hypothetical protein